MIEECNVVKVKGDYAVIELERKPECEGCKACSFNRRNSLRMTAMRSADCSVGDRVSVQMPEKSIKGSYLVLFLIPLALMLAAVLITAKYEWYVQVPSIVGALLLGLAIIVLCDGIIKKKAAYMPKIINVIKNTHHIGEANDRS